MKNIRILTFWNVPNYGAFMQAYALQKFLENRYADCNVNQLSHLAQCHYDAYYKLKTRKNYKLWYINPKFYIRFLKRTKLIRELENTKKFLSYYDSIPHTDINDDRIDVLVLGSDIIWDYNIDVFGCDQKLFGIGINAKKKISYAPGFGTVKLGMSAPEYVKKGLNELDAISVRDEKSKKIVKDLTGKDAAVVIDPTLLWNFENDENIPEPSLSHDYIVVYGSYFTKELVDGAQKYCRDNNCKLICLSSLDDKYDWCDEVVDQNNLDPFEWVGYFKHAKAVMTCTYHGLMFGLIFKKRIVFNMTEFILEKSESLIEELGIREVLVDFKSFDEKMNWNWDYKNIYMNIENLRCNSFKYLDGVINNE